VLQESIINTIRAATTIRACGDGNLQASDTASSCRIITSISKVSGCSAVKIGSNRLATAAHCLYDHQKASASFFHLAAVALA